ncbi:hypothetical protein EJ06DRAFT_526738 [Trichodelitschia bisporula]|uniref:Uncharacterized protein n=1 Tax=Trichodelitschia bisporula TaxID=703511 RepID=A0A6G1I9B9_9PEZI|nr:hypothetical protein EJ06DRAFT_526738 [Trichodelitschia bisporula]
MSVKPNQETWIWRLKWRRTTILLHVNPMNDIAAVKADLFEILSTAKGLDSSTSPPVPSSPSQIQLAVPRNPLNIEQGFDRIDVSQSPEDDKPDPFTTPVANSKSKQKTKETRPLESMNLKVLGLRDKAVVVFRIRGEEEVDDEGLGDEEWDFEIPKYEDEYGVEVEGDLGVHKEWKG